MTVEDRLTEVLRAADQFEPSPDLFAKVTRSIEEDAIHRKRLRLLFGSVAGAMVFVAGYLALAIERVDGVFEMPFWSLELLVTIIMVGLVLVLGPAIRRFSTAFEVDIFRMNKDTGRSFLRLMDIAYFLIFGAFTVMSLQYSPPETLEGVLALPRWLEGQSQRVGGLLLLIGLLHGATIVMLPVIGLVFSANMRRASRTRLGDAAPKPDRHNERVDRWITASVWVLVALGIVFVIGFLVLPLVAGLAG